MTRPLIRALAAAAVLAAGPAGAQDRPSEEELFGNPQPPAPEQRPAEAAPPAGKPPAPDEARRGEEAPVPKGTDRAREAEMFGGTGSPNAAPPPAEGVVSRAGAQEDPLKVGGQIYLRATSTWQQDVPPSDWILTSPNLLDVFLDVRPNERVRGFVLGRLSYDPTLVPGERTPGQALTTVPGVSATPLQNPRGVLDQLWLNFDPGRRVFVTAGRQHVKWGVGKFWNPTDYLHPVRRDPLAVFDVRVGTTMVKLHVPWEKRGWNFYGIAMFEDLAGELEPVDRLGRVAAGGRAELVLGPAELGLDAMTQSGHRPRFGVDLSAGIWELDVHAEAALRTGIDGSHWAPGPPTPTDLLGYVRADPQGFTPQLTLGGSWSRNYSDEDAVTLGAEYFFNDAGYSDSSIYPFLLAGAPLIDPTAPTGQQLSLRDPTAFRPFYMGRHYAGAFVYLPRPGSWNDTFLTLSVLGNLSDRSFIARLDHAVLALTYLRVETFVAGHFGHRGGEFRLAFEVPPGAEAFLPIDPRLGRAPILDLGVALRVSL
ncbi:hypothetical protein [Anaeromyxobacter oryzae]|uniref:Alginate export domain-containing protein n=1 Tax=Anaeromyxobacter oryzae TaxID=2918170 RepID=A0ABM7WX54_9BACT|nr:hypothetical protein [Anaeromyxobacter oryzae]BDG04089.1 hypothetical protein AMOR_30850 [Anaeromyxobacter oryzae]